MLSNLPPKFEQIGGKEYIISVNFLSIYGSFEYFLGYWLYITEFDAETRDLVFEGLDTLSKHSLTQSHGVIYELNNQYYNFFIYTKAILYY